MKSKSCIKIEHDYFKHFLDDNLFDSDCTTLPSSSVIHLPSSTAFNPTTASLPTCTHPNRDVRFKLIMYDINKIFTSTLHQARFEEEGRFLYCLIHKVRERERQRGRHTAREREKERET